MHNRYPSDNFNQIKMDENELFPDFFQNNNKQRLNQIEQNINEKLLEVCSNIKKEYNILKEWFQQNELEKLF